MPDKPWKPCRRSSAGCPNLTRDGYCTECEPKYGRAAQDRQRGTAAERGYGRRWQEASLRYRTAHPFCECEECKAKPEIERDLAEVVDHIKPHRGDPKLFWDRSNWRSMSKRHHDAKTAREDGAFGRASRR